MAENLSSDIPDRWHEQNLLRILTKRGKDAVPPPVEVEYSPKLMLPVPILYCYEPHKDRALPWRRKFFLPNPHLQHIMPRNESSGYGK